VVAVPKIPRDNFQCFWSTGTGWGTFELRRGTAGMRFAIKVLKGTLALRSCAIAAPGATASVTLGHTQVESRVERRAEQAVVTLAQAQTLAAHDELHITVHA
jgi:alpha-D-ribose 1-methylphosphonate 5-triphosphate synthase subunit PhnG